MAAQTQGVNRGSVDVFHRSDLLFLPLNILQGIRQTGEVFPSWYHLVKQRMI